ncbi:MAG: hypothetical protein O3A00_19825 [Planctomycetota bacterium]|nr:hypothetical protein [Planctomycetota bacterium]
MLALGIDPETVDFDKTTFYDYTGFAKPTREQYAAINKMAGYPVQSTNLPGKIIPEFLHRDTEMFAAILLHLSGNAEFALEMKQMQMDGASDFEVVRASAGEALIAAIVGGAIAQVGKKLVGVGKVAWDKWAKGPGKATLEGVEDLGTETVEKLAKKAKELNDLGPDASAEDVKRITREIEDIVKSGKKAPRSGFGALRDRVRALGTDPARTRTLHARVR